MTIGTRTTGASSAVFVSEQTLIVAFVLTSFPGNSLLKNLQNSLAWSKAQRIIADNASGPLSPETLTTWANMRTDFDRDRKKPNPYEEPQTCKYVLCY